jgi:hypothetical protein
MRICNLTRICNLAESESPTDLSADAVGRQEGVPGCCPQDHRAHSRAAAELAIQTIS